MGRMDFAGCFGGAETMSILNRRSWFFLDASACPMLAVFRHVLI